MQHPLLGSWVVNMQKGMHGFGDVIGQGVVQGRHPVPTLMLSLVLIGCPPGVLGWGRGARGRLLLLGLFMVPPLLVRAGCGRPDSLTGRLGAGPAAPDLLVTALASPELPAGPKPSWCNLKTCLMTTLQLQMLDFWHCHHSCRAAVLQTGMTHTACIIAKKWICVKGLAAGTPCDMAAPAICSNW